MQQDEELLRSSPAIGLQEERVYTNYELEALIKAPSPGSIYFVVAIKKRKDDQQG